MRADGSIRVVEVLAALSLTTDLAAGLPFEKGLRVCACTTAFAGALGLADADRRVVFQAALLRAVGCTSHASENAALFADDIAFQAALKVLDPGDREVFGRQLAQFGTWAGEGSAPDLRRRFLEVLPTEGVAATTAGCEVSHALGVRLGLEPGAVAALADVYERWDGTGMPRGAGGDGLTSAMRIVHVVEQAVIAHSVGGAAAAVAEVRRRAAGQLDPDLVAAFVEHADAVLAPLDDPDALATVVAAEPPPVVTVPFGDLDDLCSVLATVADLKGRWLVGHSHHVATLAGRAAELSGLRGDRSWAVRYAALTHDLGRVAVNSAVWDRVGPLGPVDVERVRLHPYWTQRILDRVPSLAPLATIASAHHERHAGGGYHRGLRGADLPLEARLVAAADSFAAMTEDRPHRRALPVGDAVAALGDAGRAGDLDPDSTAAVIEAAGLPRPRRELPAGLTEREVEVVRLAARGLSNREIAARLVISDRTVGHHLAHVYDKTGRRTRAGVAVFAVEHDLMDG